MTSISELAHFLQACFSFLTTWACKSVVTFLFWEKNVSRLNALGENILQAAFPLPFVPLTTGLSYALTDPWRDSVWNVSVPRKGGERVPVAGFWIGIPGSQHSGALLLATIAAKIWCTRKDKVPDLFSVSWMSHCWPQNEYSGMSSWQRATKP